MSVSLDQARLDLAEDLETQYMTRLMSAIAETSFSELPTKDTEYLARMAGHYSQQAKTLRFIMEIPERQSRLAQDILNMRMACDNYNVVRNPRRDK